MDRLVWRIVGYWLTCSEAEVRQNWIPSEADKLMAHRRQAQRMAA